MCRNGISVSRDKHRVIIKTHNQYGYELRQEFTPELATALADKILQQVTEIEREKYTKCGGYTLVRRK